MTKNDDFVEDTYMTADTTREMRHKMVAYRFRNIFKEIKMRLSATWLILTGASFISVAFRGGSGKIQSAVNSKDVTVPFFLWYSAVDAVSVLQESIAEKIPEASLREAVANLEESGRYLDYINEIYQTRS